MLPTLLLAMLVVPQRPIFAEAIAAVDATTFQAETDRLRNHWDNADFVITIFSLTMSGIDTATTMICVMSERCVEANLVMRDLIGQSKFRAILFKSGVQAVAHYVLWRCLPRGWLRTTALSILAGGNTYAGIHNMIELRDILRK